MKKILFLIFHGFDPYNGISKKVSYQVDALRTCGMEVHLCYMDESFSKKRIVDNMVIADYGNTTISKILKRMEFASIVKYAIDSHIDLVYIRSNHNANPFTIKMVKRMKQAGMKVVMEIPTYPYDAEYHAQGMDKQIFLDKVFRQSLAKHLDAIITFSDDKRIFGQRTIRISNGIDFRNVKVKTAENDTNKALNLIGVAEIHGWHGFDRVVKGLAVYYAQQPAYIVRFHVVGYFYSAEGEKEFRKMVSDLQMDEYVIDSIGIGFETPEGKKLVQDVSDLSFWACNQFVPNSSKDEAVHMMHETMQSMYIFGMVYEMERLGMR